MDERIDLTQNRDFRHEREPYFKDAHFFNFNPKYRNSKWISLERRMRNNVDRQLEFLDKEIIIRDGRIYIEKSCNIIDYKNKITTCYRCGRKFILNKSTLCDKCNSEIDIQMNRVLNTHINNARVSEGLRSNTIEITTVDNEVQLSGINETGTENAEQLIEDFLNEE